MQFAQGGELDKLSGGAADMLMGIPRADLFHAAQTIILAIIGLMVVLLVVRPILKKILEGGGSGMSMEQQSLLTGGTGGYGGGIPQRASPGGSAAANMDSAVAEAESEFERMIDISRVEGRVKASSLRKVGEIVDKHPDEAISILRNWMYQENR